MATRRDVLRWTGAAAVPLLAASCSPGSDPGAPDLVDAAQRQAFAGGVDVRAPRPGNGMNAVVVLLDSLRRDHVGAYGGTAAQTPALDALARDATRFTSAYPEAMPSMQVRRAVHTGRRTYPLRDYLPQRGIDIFVQGWQRIPEDQTTLAEVLQAAGYTTALFTDNPFMFQPSMNFHRGFDVWDHVRGQDGDHYRSVRQVDEATVDRFLPDGMRGSIWEFNLRRYLANIAGRGGEDDYFAPQVFARASRWLDDARGLTPFLMVLDVYDPHEPWDPPPADLALYDDSDYRGIDPIAPNYGPSDYLDQRQIDRTRALYAGEVTMVDRWLGRFLDDLGSRGLADDTLVIVFADHGVLLGDRGLIGKPAEDSLWPEITDIPLLVRHPERGRGAVVEALASTHDLTPTILGALEIDVDLPVDGQDLVPLLDGDRAGDRMHMTSIYGDHVWVRRGDHILMARADGSEARLFDIAADPGQARDLAADDRRRVRELFTLAERDAGGRLPRYDLEQLQQLYRFA